MRKAALLLAAPLIALLALPAGAAQIGTTTRAAELRSTPFADGKTIATLAPNTAVQVIKRVGGWYEVKAGKTAGWVRMWTLRFSAQSGSTGRDAVAVLQSGRSGSTYTTATTGVRGLSEEDLKNAQPDAAALQAMEQMGTTQPDARGFALQAGLKASPGLLREAQ